MSCALVLLTVILVMIRDAEYLIWQTGIVFTDLIPILYEKHNNIIHILALVLQNYFSYASTSKFLLLTADLFCYGQSWNSYSSTITEYQINILKCISWQSQILAYFHYFSQLRWKTTVYGQKVIYFKIFRLFLMDSYIAIILTCNLIYI